MITSLGLTNFKSWASVENMRLAPITGLFGANSSGKTSILQLLLLLKQTVESPDRNEVLHFGDERNDVALGSFREVVHRHDDALSLAWSLGWRLPNELIIKEPEQFEKPPLSGDSIQFEASVVANGTGAPAVQGLSYTFAGQRFALAREKAGYAFPTGHSFYQFKRSQGRPPQSLPPPVKCYGFPDAVRAAYQDAGFLADLELEYARLFRSIYYLGPLRDYPKRQYLWAGAQPQDVGRRGELAVHALLSARQHGWTVRPGPHHKSKPLDLYIAERLRSLGLVHEFTVEPEKEGSDVYRVWVRVRPGSERVLLTDVGFGVSQVLPVLVLCYYAPEGSTIILEQPEIHLHPSVQSGLADILIDAMRARRIQILVESHSEHLLRRLQRRLAEEYRRTRKDTPFGREDCALYFCRTSAGVSRMDQLELDRFGNITNWPEGFFGDDFAEIKAMQDAQLRRRREAAS